MSFAGGRGGVSINITIFISVNDSHSRKRFGDSRIDKV